MPALVLSNLFLKGLQLEQLVLIVGLSCGMDGYI